MLTREFDSKAHAYEAYHEGLLSNEGSTIVSQHLRGPDKLSSSFGLILKGIQTLAQLFPEDEVCLDRQREIVRSLFMIEDPLRRLTLEILDRRQRYTWGDKSPIFFKKA